MNAQPTLFPQVRRPVWGISRAKIAEHKTAPDTVLEAPNRGPNRPPLCRREAAMRMVSANRICDVPGCGQSHYGRGWCRSHYRAWWSANGGQGDPRRRPESERFWAKVSGGDYTTCWLWVGGLSKGYGSFRRTDASLSGLAHRFAYEHLIGEVPSGLVLDHLCRETRCVNPWHLQPVPQRINTLRGVGPAARRAVATHCARGHEFSYANTYLSPAGHRTCRTCVRLRRRAA